MLAETPPPPYYMVVFTSMRGAGGDGGYADMAARMVELAAQQPGFLGVETARAQIGITVSYWADLDSIAAWKKNTEHLAAQQKGREIWYRKFQVRIGRVEKDYGFSRADD